MARTGPSYLISGTLSTVVVSDNILREQLDPALTPIELDGPITRWLETSTQKWHGRPIYINKRMLGLKLLSAGAQTRGTTVNVYCTIVQTSLD